MNKRKVIIDTDPGIDDAVALLYALKNPELEVLGITAVGGNKGVNITANNATKIIKYLGLDIKVYPGEAVSYTDYKLDPIDSVVHDATDIHGSDGLGGVQLEPDTSLISDISATTFILDTIKKFPNEVSILALGPLTNIAYCIDLEPETMEKVISIHSMGGGIEIGNRTPYAEFNYWYDPESVNKVLELGEKVPFYMIGLNATYQSELTPKDILYLKTVDPKIGTLIFDMVQSYMKIYWDRYKKLGVVFHDLLTIVGFVDPSIYTVVKRGHMHCVVDNNTTWGACILKENEEFNVYIPWQLDLKKYKQDIVDTLFDADVYEEYVSYILD